MKEKIASFLATAKHSILFLTEKWKLSVKDERDLLNQKGVIKHSEAFLATHSSALVGCPV